MSETPNKPDFKEIAGQLGCPSGDKGLRTAESMAINNGNMITLTISELNLKPNDVVLEIGPGNGSHVIQLLKDIKYLLYYGVDISSLMISEAVKLNESFVTSGRADFSLSDGEKLNFAADFFTRIFTVNTLYFWRNPKAYAAEILRVLKPGGLFSLTFGSREFMEKLPFTQYDFQLYSQQEAEELLLSSGFKIRSVNLQTEKVRSNAGMDVERDIIIINAVKPLI
ncbi:ubiquinone/menaquinone biosynthesis C-methylase UbiE [Pedobacter cryoconitis]|uniref:Ubiquinone/menaquinone biosynthesis C-methylase UbiE n=1 Tax=Pedobacter cryoconitis TaxID=188932 RepID=A0A7W9DZE2_9SPHI|nr:class I SAM-dependent methyltransferase [Pedobacter cryoconitis]MBB5636953.1 ubiquinone/menaquinone biosynthesis C-methylase UbiE [Pedobacter cryoconitis]